MMLKFDFVKMTVAYRFGGGDWIDITEVRSSPFESDKSDEERRAAEEKP